MCVHVCERVVSYLYAVFDINHLHVCPAFCASSGSRLSGFILCWSDSDSFKPCRDTLLSLWPRKTTDISISSECTHTHTRRHIMHSQSRTNTHTDIHRHWQTGINIHKHTHMSPASNYPTLCLPLPQQRPFCLYSVLVFSSMFHPAIMTSLSK